MELQVNKNTTVRELKEQFSKQFPFLKLEFFSYRRSAAEENFTREVYNGLNVEETSEFFKEGVVDFSPSTTVADFEQKLQIELGLAVKVYRRSGDLWVETAQTEHLSLGKQNTMGAAPVKQAIFNINTLFL